MWHIVFYFERVRTPEASVEARTLSRRAPECHDVPKAHASLRAMLRCFDVALNGHRLPRALNDRNGAFPERKSSISCL